MTLTSLEYYVQSNILDGLPTKTTTLPSTLATSAKTTILTTIENATNSSTFSTQSKTSNPVYFWSAILVRDFGLWIPRYDDKGMLYCYFISEFIIHREVNGALALDWSIDTTAPP